MGIVCTPLMDTRERLIRELRTCRTFEYDRVMDKAADELEKAWAEIERLRAPAQSSADEGERNA